MTQKELEALIRVLNVVHEVAKNCVRHHDYALADHIRTDLKTLAAYGANVTATTPAEEFRLAQHGILEDKDWNKILK